MPHLQRLADRRDGLVLPPHLEVVLVAAAVVNHADDAKEEG